MGEFDRPFVGSAAVRAGSITRHSLSKDYTRIYRDVYLRKGIRVDASIRAQAAMAFGGPGTVLAGISAAAAHGSKWIPDDAAAEIIRIGHQARPVGLTIRTDHLAPTEIVRTVIGAATSPARTAFDIGRRLPLADAIEKVDALCNATGLLPSDIDDVLARHPGARGVARVRRVLRLVDAGAESPAETRTRLLIVGSGLPRPTTQLQIRDEWGRVVARADLGWREWHVIVEYDGEQHWSDRRQRAWDIDRTAILERLGWRIVRVSSLLLTQRPHVVIERVRGALLAAGAPITLAS